MRKFIIILVIANCLAGIAVGQTYIPLRFSQPQPLTALAGHDTLVCTGHSITLGGAPTAAGGNNSYVFMWSPPDGLDDPTSSNPTATLSQSKSYMLTVTDAQGCEAVSFISVYVDPCLGIDEKNLNPVLTVFPNPSNGVFTLKGISSFDGHLERIEVLNQLGQIVFRTLYGIGDPNSDIEIDTRIEESGVYYLQVTFSDKVVSQRLIVR
jgi:hypothetical protein